MLQMLYKNLIIQFFLNVFQCTSSNPIEIGIIEIFEFKKNVQSEIADHNGPMHFQSFRLRQIIRFG